MMKNVAAVISFTALTLAAPLTAQETETPKIFSPGQIVDQAMAEEWVAIAPSDLLVMDLAPGAGGTQRRVIIQLMPPPFSQGWIRNIRKLAKAHWWDGTEVLRVQDNYVVQWGDGGERDDARPLPDGLEVVPESDYTVDGDTLSEFTETKIHGDSGQSSARIVALSKLAALEHSASGADLNEEQLAEIVGEMEKILDSGVFEKPTRYEEIKLLSIESTQTELTSQGWHERDGFAGWVEFWRGWPLGNFNKSTWKNEDGEQVQRPSNTQRHVLSQQKVYRDEEVNEFWPVHCYGMVGVGRGLSPETGDGSSLYTVIGHSPRHLDRNIAVVGRIIEGMHHLSSLPRGFGPLGFYETPEERTAIQSVRLASELQDAEQPKFEYLESDTKSFAQYIVRRANREPPFFIKPAGGADICNIPVPVRRVKAE